MGLVHKYEEVFREVVQQRPWGATFGAAGKMAGVVLYSGTKPGFLEHLQVIVGTAFQARCFEHLAVCPQSIEPLLQLHFDILDSHLQLLFGGHKVVGREYKHVLLLGQKLPGEGV